MKALKIFLRIIILASAGLFIVWALMAYRAAVLMGLPHDHNQLNWFLTFQSSFDAYCGLFIILVVAAIIVYFVMGLLVCFVDWVFKND